MEKEAILVSACLLGVNCRYDGGGGRSEEVLKLMERYHLIPVCPEQMGGMKTPRKPAELRKEKGPDGEEVRKVFNEAGEDVTEFFIRGAKEVLELAKLYGCTRAVLKERSPSCGCGIVYDGTFSGKRVPGNGITAKLLLANNITVLGESKAALLWKEWDVQD